MSDIVRSTVIEARQRADAIRQGMVSFLDLLDTIGAAHAAQDWLTLGYDTWDAYVAAEFSEARLRLPRGERQRAVQTLRLAGMSTRAIAATIGVSVGTVHSDTQAFSSEHLPAEVTGTDGKVYAATRPPAEPMTPEETRQAAELTKTIDAGLQEIDRLILFALSNRVDPALIVGWLTTWSYRLADLCADEEFLAPVRRHIIDPRIRFVLDQGRRVADELAGPDIERKPLTEAEISSIGARISGLDVR